MRPFSGCPEDALRAAAGDAIGRVSAIVGQLPAPAQPGPQQLLAYCDALRAAIEQLSREDRRLEALADELVLRAHWRAVRSAR